MKLVGWREFTAQLAAAGIRDSDPQAGTHWLGFLAAPDEWRLWDPPSSPTRLLDFLRTAMELASPSGSIWLLRRHGGPWRERHEPGPSVLVNRVIAAVGIPGEFEGAVGFSKAEQADLLLVVVGFYLEARHAGQDLYLIPSERACVLMTSHHGDISGRFPDAAARERFEAGMRAAGFDEGQADA